MDKGMELSQDQWQKFFDQFSQVYRGWQTKIEVMGKDLGDQEEVTGVPFQGISYVAEGTGAGNMEIAVGEKPNNFSTHCVEKPSQVWVTDAKPGVETDVEIVARDGRRFLIHLSPEKALSA